MTLLSAVVLMMVVMDPLGNIPFFLASLAPVEPARRGKVLRRELLFAYVVLVAFLFLGEWGLRLFQLSEPALTLSGGVILFLISIRMIFPSPEQPLEEELAGEPFVVPLAIPYIAGPSALATVMVLMSKEPTRWPTWLLVVTLAWLASSVILYLGGLFLKLMGERGLLATTRLMGMVLVAVAIQMVLVGIERFIATLPPRVAS